MKKTVDEVVHQTSIPVKAAVLESSPPAPEKRSYASMVKYGPSGLKVFISIFILKFFVLCRSPLKKGPPCR